MTKTPKKVVLAYSGGLDTSVIAKWLQVAYGCEVVAFTADLGQGGEISAARKTAAAVGIQEVHVEDLRERFVRDYVFAMLRANPLYEGSYLLGTAIARPLIAQAQIDLAYACGADAVAHGATGKGNDQVRFELAYRALAPDLHVIAPWREWDLESRSALLAFAREHQIPVPHHKNDEPPFSTDANLFHTSSEGRILEDPSVPCPEDVYQRTVNPLAAPDTPEDVEIRFEKGDPVCLDGTALSAAALLESLNTRAGAHGVGRVDLVENRITGMKSRGVYETPGGTVLLAARRALESLTLDREAAHLKEDVMPRYTRLVYNGLWFSPERQMLQTLIDHSQTHVTGVVRVRLYKGSVSLLGRDSPFSLYSAQDASFETHGSFSPRDAQGFITLQALRLRLSAQRRSQT